jgi:ribosome modulation factor
MDVYDEGHMAGRDRQMLVAHCPYERRDSDRRRAWMAGFNHARAEIAAAAGVLH